MGAVIGQLFSLFGRRESAVPAAPVRPDQVMRLLNLSMREFDADEQELSMAEPGDQSPRYDRAAAEYWAAWRNSTPAERAAADEAARWHGTGDWWDLSSQVSGDGRAR